MLEGGIADTLVILRLYMNAEDVGDMLLSVAQCPDNRRTEVKCSKGFMKADFSVAYVR